MANLYLRSIPEELYRALRKRAQQHRNTIAAEIRTMLDENFPTVSVLRKRKKIFKGLENLRLSVSPGPGPFPSSEQMQGEDRER
jgi:plasmid stability protein